MLNYIEILIIKVLILLTSVNCSYSSKNSNIKANSYFNQHIYDVYQNSKNHFSEHSQSRKLGRYIKNYHPLTYDNNAVHKDHLRLKKLLYETETSDKHINTKDNQSFKDSKTIEIKFNGKDRYFHLKLAPDTNLFTNDFETKILGKDGKVESFKRNDKQITFQPISHVYYGHLHGEPNTSNVHGSIINGVFQQGVIHTINGTYYVDHIKEHLDGKLTSPNFHSVIYHENNIDYPFPSFNHVSNCIDSKYGPSPPEEWLNYPPEDMNPPENDEETENSQKTEKSRNKRSIFNARKSADLDRTTCILGIEVDHLFYNHFGNREEVIASVSSHVRAISDIYRLTKFTLPSTGELYQGINFQVKRVQINAEDDKKSPYHKKNMGVERFLEKASEGDYDDFCLHYVFTKRDFDNGVLGLAWVAQPRAAVGGICERHRSIPGSGRKSMNTGIITIENYGNSVPSRVSHLTFAHEVGHNFGSPHDSGKECTPGEGNKFSLRSDGNYIMFSRATSGLNHNNKLFSPCSIRNISAVLEVKSSCFIRSDAPICGNGIVDASTEECDCGFASECAARNDRCCVPAGSRDPNEKECTLYKRKVGGKDAECSVSQGPCCKNDCTFYGTDKLCAEDRECRSMQNCSGNSYTCPEAPKKADKTLCAHKTQVCQNGECTGSICEHYGLDACTCQPTDEKDFDIYCHACCQAKGDNTTCASTGSERWTRFFNKTIIYLQPGSPCDNYDGYCDVYSKCRRVDADGPLRRLRKVFFNMEVYEDIRDFVHDYWWAVILLALALVLAMAGFIQICSTHTPTSNPKLPPHTSIYNSMRRRGNANSRQMNSRQMNHNARDNYGTSQFNSQQDFSNNRR